VTADALPPPTPFGLLGLSPADRRLPPVRVMPSPPSQVDEANRVTFAKPVSVGIGDINFKNLLRKPDLGVYNAEGAPGSPDGPTGRRRVGGGARCGGVGGPRR